MLKERDWISCDALTTDLEVEVIRRGTARAAYGADDRSGPYPVARLDEVPAVVGVDGAESIRVLDLDDPAIGRLSSAEEHRAGGCRANGRARRGLDVNATMRTPGTRAAKPRNDLPFYGPHED
jgi:hypothetical protein